jgi:tetratricopeptide (TPR) repeat protein
LQASILQAQNRTAEARQNLEKALLLGPHVSACYIQLATLLWKENEKKAAVDTLERCVKIMPECSAAWQQLAEYYMDTKEFRAAEHAINAALAGMPPLQERHRLNLVASNQMALLSAGLGGISYRNNELAKALRQAELFNQLKFIPDLPDYLKVIKLRPGRIQPDKLLAKEREAAQHAELADMLFQTRQMADCIKEYKKAIELDPDDLDLQEYLFNATADSGNWMDSIGQDWTLSNKLISKGVKALSEMNKKKPAESGDK